MHRELPDTRTDAETATDVPRPPITDQEMDALVDEEIARREREAKPAKRGYTAGNVIRGLIGILVAITIPFLIAPFSPGLAFLFFIFAIVVIIMWAWRNT